MNKCIIEPEFMFKVNSFTFQFGFGILAGRYELF